MIELTETRKRQIEMLISYFNAKAKTRYRFGAEKNVEAVYNALNAAAGDVYSVREFYKGKIEDGCVDLITCSDEFCRAKGFVDSEKPVPVQAPIQPAVPSSASAALDLLGGIVMDMLSKMKMSEIEASVASRLEDNVRKFIADNYGPIERKVKLDLGERKVDIEGTVHEKFETVLKFVQANEPVFLTGPAGSGKNVLCQQVAKTLGLPFYFSNAVTQEYKITGFTDAMGTFHESQFYKAFKNGGVFMLDEMDASIPEVLIILNAAIANRYFDFPAPIGYVEAHKDFRVIAAGNTFGAGADYDYVGRNQLDAASLDRFAMVRVDYSPAIEESCAMGNADLLNFCRKFRAAVKEAGIRTVVSYRAISRMAKLTGAMPIDDLLDSCLLKSLEVDDLNAIRDDVAECGDWTISFNRILNNRKKEAK